MDVVNRLPGYVKAVDKEYVILQTNDKDREFRVPLDRPIKMGSSIVSGPGYYLEVGYRGDILIFEDNTIGFQRHVGREHSV